MTSGFVIAIAQRKGGAGKTTLACQLTAAFLACGRSVFGLDTDEQRSYSRWSELRTAECRPCSRFKLDRAAGFGFAAALRHARERADIVIVDTPPSVDATVERAVRGADLVVTPLQLSPIDLDATLPTASLVGQIGRPALFVINRAPPRAKIADLIRDKITQYRLPIAATELGNRAAFAESMASGAGVVDTAPTSLAAREIEALAEEISTRIGRTAAVA